MANVIYKIAYWVIKKSKVNQLEVLRMRKKEAIKEFGEVRRLLDKAYTDEMMLKGEIARLEAEIEKMEVL